MNAVLAGVLFGLGLPVLAQPSAPGQTGQTTGLRGPYLGQPAPGTTPVLFAPGVVSRAGFRVSACAFSADGKEFYFTKGNELIMVSRLTELGWTAPAPFAVSGGHRAFEPHVTRDNKRIYWNWDNPEHPGLSVYFAERTADGWSAATYAGEGMFVSSSNDGLVYVTHMGAESDYVSRAVFKNGRIVGYEDLRGGIEKIRSRSGSVAHPCVAPDGGYIVFDIDGGPHLFVSFREKDGSWGEAVDLTEHGLDVKAGIASITPDGQYLFFGQGGDLYWVSTRLIEGLRPKGR